MTLSADPRLYAIKQQVVVVRPSLSTMTNDITGLNKTWCDEFCCG